MVRCTGWKFTSSFTGLAVIASIIVGALSDPARATAARPIISGGTVRTASGDLFRGGSLHISKSYTTRANGWGANRDSLRFWRDKIHYNCIRLCCLDPRAIMDGRPTSAFSTVEEEFPLADAVINNADSLGIYVILDFHCPQFLDQCSCPWDFRKFWTSYAPRYKDRTHVMYEMLNEGSGCDAPAGAWPRDLWAQCYKIMRAAAPNTMILHCDPACMEEDWGPFLRDSYAPAAGFRWDSGKDAFAFHTYYPCTVPAIKGPQALGIPVICTEYSYVEEGSVGGTLVIEGCKYPAQWMEKNGISWMDWVLWNRADQSYPRMTWLIPDATSKGWAWWGAAGTDPIARAPLDALVDKPIKSIMINANGRIIDKQAAGNREFTVSIQRDFNVEKQDNRR